VILTAAASIVGAGSKVTWMVDKLQWLQAAAI